MRLSLYSDHSDGVGCAGAGRRCRPADARTRPDGRGHIRRSACHARWCGGQRYGRSPRTHAQAADRRPHAQCAGRGLRQRGPPVRRPPRPWRRRPQDRPASDVAGRRTRTGQPHLLASRSEHDAPRSVPGGRAPRRNGDAGTVEGKSAAAALFPSSVPACRFGPEGAPRLRGLSVEPWLHRGPRDRGQRRLRLCGRATQRLSAAATRPPRRGLPTTICVTWSRCSRSSRMSRGA